MDSPVGYGDSPLEGDDMVYPCKGCGQILEEGKAFELAGSRWHIDCFRCNTCNTILDSDANLLLLGDGSLICNNCTYSCNACGNKIEDLAILTGDQAFCSNCFRCRNCKRKIENLRYARTSHGIFCMACHETLMSRRRKKPRSTPKPGQNGLTPVQEKALPSLPPGAGADSILPLEMDTPGSDIAGEMFDARSPSDKRYPSRRDVQHTSPLSHEAHRGDPSLSTLPGAEERPSNVSQDTEDGDERGYLPMAFDPNPAPAPTSSARKPSIPGQDQLSSNQGEQQLSRDYFNRSQTRAGARDMLREDRRPGSSSSASAERDPDRLGSQQKSSPHILYQDKGRPMKRGTSASNTPATSAAASPAAGLPHEDRHKPQALDVAAIPVDRNENFKLGDVPPSKKTGSRGSKGEVRSPASPIGVETRDGPRDRIPPSSPQSIGSPSSINPFDDPRRFENGGGSGSTPTSRHPERPTRGDSLTTMGPRKASLAAPEQTVSGAYDTASKQLNDQRKGSTTSIPASVKDAHTALSRDNSRSKGKESPRIQPVLDAPPPRASSRPTLANKSTASDDFIAPRPPPPPPIASADRVASEGRLDGSGSPSLGTHNLHTGLEDGFSMDEEMSRIMSGDTQKDGQAKEGASSMLRKVSNAVKHGRSLSAANANADNSPPISISSPMSAAQSGGETNDSLAVQLRRAQQRIAELEAANRALEEKVNSSHEIKAATSELQEKRSTIVVLDTQREIVVRELENITTHLVRAKDSSEPLDLNALKSDILRDFTDSLQKLKDQTGAQIEVLVHKRNELTDEISNLIQMKDKGFQEYENLSSKNAQLLEMNNQILHNIQEMYKSNRAPNGTNGLGIYQVGSRSDSSSGPSDLRNLNLVSTDSSMPNLLQETEAEPATVLTAPQVVNIRNAQPKKFNWRKGGEKMAKNVTKGLKGAFSVKDGEGLQYGQPSTASSIDQNGLASRQALDPGRQGTGFGLFGQKNGTARPQGSSLKGSNSNPNLASAQDASVLFGSELEARCEYEKRVIPSIVSRCIEEVESRGIDMEGVYRKSGGSGQVKAVQAGFEKDGSFDISDPDLDLHAVTSTLKQYFRRLPTPLITYDVYDNFLEAGSLADKEKQGLALHMAVSELPEAHRNCLEFLFQHLARVVSYQADNLMTPLNLAVVFAPTIMRPLSIEREMSDMQGQRAAVQAMLEQHSVVFAGEE